MGTVNFNMKVNSVYALEWRTRILYCVQEIRKYVGRERERERMGRKIEKSSWNVDERTTPAWWSLLARGCFQGHRKSETATTPSSRRPRIKRGWRLYTRVLMYSQRYTPFQFIELVHSRKVSTILSSKIHDTTNVTAALADRNFQISLIINFEIYRTSVRKKASNFPSGKLATSWFTTVSVDGKFDASRKIRSTEFRHGGHWCKVLGKERKGYSITQNFT